MKGIQDDEIEQVTAQVRAAEPGVLNTLDALLDRPEASTSARTRLRCLRTFALLQCGDIRQAGDEAGALLPFAERKGDHSVVAQLHRVLACRAEIDNDQRARLRHLQSAITAAERAGEETLLVRVEQDLAVLMAESGRAAEAAKLLRARFERVDWANPAMASLHVSLAQTLAWCLNYYGRGEDALRIANAIARRPPTRVYEAALLIEMWRAKQALDLPLSAEELEPMLALALANDWHTVKCSLHLLISRCAAAATELASVHAELAYLSRHQVRSCGRAEILERAAECRRAHGDEKGAANLEHERDVLRDSMRNLAAAAAVELEQV